MITLGDVYDPDGREVTVEVNLGKASRILVVSPDQSTIKLREEVGVLTEEHVGLFEIKVKLSVVVDESVTTTDYSLKIVVAEEGSLSNLAGKKKGTVKKVALAIKSKDVKSGKS